MSRAVVLNILILCPVGLFWVCSCHEIGDYDPHDIVLDPTPHEPDHGHVLLTGQAFLYEDEGMVGSCFEKGTS